MQLPEGLLEARTATITVRSLLNATVLVKFSVLDMAAYYNRTKFRPQAGRSGAID